METEQADASDVQTRLSNFFAQPEVATEEAPQAEAPQETAETPQEVPQESEVVEDDLDELDLDGEIYKVPKALKAKAQEWKDGYLRREDYTRKTQELADLHRQAQFMAEALQQRQAFEKAVSTEANEMARVQAELERYKAVDWGNLEVQDYIKVKHQQDQLKERYNELKGAIDKKSAELSEKLTEHKRKVLDEAQKYLQKSVPNWGPEAVSLAQSGAKGVGYTDGELENVYDARFVQLSWKAAQYDKLQSSKPGAIASVQKAPPVVKPGAGMGQQAASDRAYKEVRSSLKKSGSLQDAARLMMMRGNK